MLELLLAVLFLVIAVAAMVMHKTYYYVPPRELKRQAAHHEPLAQVLWRAVAFGGSLRILLWSVTILSAAIGLVFLAHVVPSWLAIVVVAAVLLYTFGWIPNTQLTSFGGRVTVWGTPTVVWLLTNSHGVLNWLQKRARRHVIKGHTGLYEREDLLEFLEAQKKQPDSRIEPADMAMAQSALTFGTKVVRDVLTPRRVVKAIGQADSVGPVVMDDLHKSGFSRFPVYDGKQDNIVGVLYLRDLVRTKASGQVSKYMHDQVCYVHEDQSLRDALQAILKTHQQLFVVVNSFEEYVGIVTIEDILEEIIGAQIVDEFDQYEDLRAVAARMAAKDHKTHHEAPVAKPIADKPPKSHDQPTPELEPVA